MHNVLALAVASLCVAGNLSAQNTWVTFTGEITDPTHAGIPEASVSVEGPESNSIHTLKTGPNGTYFVSFLEPGTYTVRASASGFQEGARERVEANAGETILLPLTLQVGEVNARITVSEPIDLIQTESASRSSIIDAVGIRAFPVLGRQVFNVLSLSPGVLFTQQEFGADGYSGLRNWEIDGKYIINGGLEGTNQFLLNGAPISLTGRWQISPSMEAVEEVKVLTNTYDAQYGRTGGGTVATSLRTGGNHWNGEAYEFFRNAALDANTFDNNLIGWKRGKHIAHQYGGIVNGPLRKNKDFLFASMDDYWEVASLGLVSNTPPLALRDGQHFTQYRITIYNPYSTHPCTDTATCLTPYVRDPFPGNVIPKSMISPIGAAILGLYPAPNTRGVTQNFNASGYPGHFTSLQPIARWDHSFSDRDRLYTLFAFDHQLQHQSDNGFAGPADSGSGNTQRTSQHYVLDWTRVISASAVLDVRASFGRFTLLIPESDCSTAAACVTASDLGIQLPHAPTVQSDTAPHIGLGFYESIIGNTVQWRTENQLDLSPGFTFTSGRHVFHFGGEFAAAGIGEGGPGRANGELDFTRGWSEQYPGTARGYSDGSPLADLLLGLPSMGYIDYSDSSYRRWPYFAGYLQDNWKLRPGLTISLGLRYDVQIPFTELHNRFNAVFDPNAKSPLSDAIIANWNASKSTWDAQNPTIPYPDAPAEIRGGLVFPTGSRPRAFRTDWTDIQPRVGIAWNFAPKTVLRAGAGIFYRTANETGSSYGYNQRTYYQRSLDGGLTPSAGITGADSLADPFPNGIATPAGAAAGLLAGVGGTIAFDNPNRPIARTYEYSFGFQRELPGLMLLEADYSGSLTVHDALPVLLNAPPIGQSTVTNSQANYLDTLVPNPLYKSGVPETSLLGGTALVSIGALLRPYPQFDAIREDNLPVARYRYDSLQVKLEKRVLDVAPAGIFSFALAYTFSKSFAADHRLNPSLFDEKPIHELSPNDRPQSIGFAGTWDLPFGWGRHYLNHANSFVAALVNSWAVDWVYLYQSGAPVNTPDATFTCASYETPGGQTAQHWFNDDRSCWTPRTVWTYRTTPDRFDNIRTPAAGQMNLSIEKTIWLNERYSMQLRGEAYNLTNTPLFGAPSTDLNSPRFGELPLRQSNLPRSIQLALRFSF